MTTFEQYKEAVAKGDKEGERRAVDALLKEHDKLIRKFANRFSYGAASDDKDEMLQAARIGMIRTFKSWDPSRAKLSTYACWWIRHEVQYCRDKQVTIHRPRGSLLPYRVEQLIEQFQAKHGRYPEPEEVGVTTEELEVWNNKFSFVPLDESFNEWEGGNQYPLREAIPDEDEVPCDEIAGEGELSDRMRHALQVLPELTRRVIALHVLEEMTLRDVALRLCLPETIVKHHRDLGLESLRSLLGYLAEDEAAE